ncbi:MAG: thioredoxin family protein [Candidatus Babeliales bacterium]
MKKTNLLLAATVCLATLGGCKWSCCSHSHDAEKAEQTEQSKPTVASAVIAVESNESFEKEVIKSEKPVIADFSAQWCGACQTMKPLFEELAQELDMYKFVTINVDAAEKIAHDYNVSGIPMFAFFSQGKEINKDNRIVGAISKEDFKKAIEKAFKS